MEESEIIQMIENKGIAVDCFDPLDQVFELLYSDLEKLKLISNTLMTNIRGYVKSDWSVPFNSNDVYDIEYKISKMKLEYAAEMRYIIDDFFPNISLDSDDFDNFLKTQDKFNARSILYYFFEKYAPIEDILTLTQVQDCVKRALPFKNGEKWYGEKIEKVEDLILSSKKGVKFSTSSRDVINKIIMLANMVSYNDLPSKVEGWYYNYKGDSYYCDNFTVKIFKNGFVNVTFTEMKDFKLFCEAIFMNPSDLMKVLYEEN